MNGMNSSAVGKTRQFSSFQTSCFYLLACYFSKVKEMLQGRRYLMFISYVGTGFCGSQIQPKGVRTVQYVIEEALRNVFELPGERPIRVFMGSRTDAGVHALKAAVHTYLPQFHGRYLHPETLQIRLNKYLSDSENVRVVEAYSFNNSFNVYSALLHKVYMLRVGLLKKEFYDKSRIVPVLEIDRTHLIRMNLDFDINKAREAASLFEGQKDFGGVLGRPSRNLIPTTCNIKSFKVEEAQPLLPFDPLSNHFNFYHFICKGDRFLYCMVRRMVTLAVSAGYNRISLESIENLLRNPVPALWPKNGIKVVSGSGLYLVDTVYDMEKIKLESSNLVEEEGEVKSQELVA